MTSRRERRRRQAGERSTLLTALAVLGAIPVATGALGMFGGPERAPGGAETTASVDSEYRFVNVFWAAAGGVLWWTLRAPEQRAQITRFVLSLAALGGLPRLLSISRRGLPHPVFQATLVLELVVLPFVLAWHRRVITPAD
ncbi:DUF4345 domain-containing protein [Naasia lichenicola]|uniref:DUF4345 domain-containing protein n=1 Tax=Naasia lichenicola TaxID=2565933 RepID=A0A4V3WTV5_9MICO|nr:DUF4345 domain-containing protein [Naasia lichenicola]THG33437.1 DUF4345 domain-containing protein [Naasia lichenicola]